ncbi:MAG: hypothetical protein AAGF67_13405 [Verrucomicrobiota bacterium]
MKAKFSFTLLAFFFSTLAHLLAEEPEALSTSRAGYERALENAVSPIQENYIEHLTKLQSNYTRNNNLDGAVAVRKEIESLDKTVEDDPVKTEPSEEHEELNTSRANYEKAVKRAKAPIHEKFRNYLTQLQREYTRSNNLDGALAVRKEIELLEKVMQEGGAMVTSSFENEPLSMEEEMIEWLGGREFRWNGSTVDQVVLQFDGDQVRAEADGREILERKFKVLSPDAIQFEWSNGEINTFTVDNRKRSFTRFMARSGSSHTGTIHARSKS